MTYNSITLFKGLSSFFNLKPNLLSVSIISLFYILSIIINFIRHIIDISKKWLIGQKRALMRAFLLVGY